MRTLCFFFTLYAISASAQSVPQVQRPLLSKITATWCPPCGSWGWDLFEDLVEDNENEAILLATHYSGDLVSTTATELAANLGANGQPQFYLDNERQSASSSTASQARTAIEAAIDTEAARMPLAGSRIRTTAINGNALELAIDVEFFAAGQGEYRVAAYVVEDDVVNQQASRGANAVHERVLRGDLGTGTFGTLLKSGLVAAGEKYTVDLAYTLPASYNPAHIRLVSAIWKLDGSNFEYINGSETTDWSTVSTTKTLAASAVELSSFSESGTLYTDISLRLSAKQVRLQLLAIDGRVLAERVLGNLQAETRRVAWSTNDLSPGVYVVRLQTNTGERSQQVVVR